MHHFAYRLLARLVVKREAEKYSNSRPIKLCARHDVGGEFRDFENCCFANRWHVVAAHLANTETVDFGSQSEINFFRPL